MRMYALAAAALLASPAWADDVADIRAAAHAFEAAEQAGDAAALAGLLAPGFLFVRGTGEVGDARDFLAGFGGGTALRIEPAGDPLLLRPTADTAIVGGEARASVREGAGGFRQRYRYSQMLVRQGGRWRVLYLHIGALP